MVGLVPLHPDQDLSQLTALELQTVASRGAQGPGHKSSNRGPGLALAFPF